MDTEGRYKKKDELVQAVADNVLTTTYYEVSGSNSLTIQSRGRGGWRKEVKQKIQSALDKHTPETWKQLQEKTKRIRRSSCYTKKDLKRLKEQDTYEDLLAREKKVAVAKEAQETNAKKLRSVADSMQKSIDDKLADRLTNTARRARMAANIAKEGERLQFIQQTLRNIADGIESGKVELIDGINSKAQVETLERILHLSKYNKWKAEGEQGRYEEEINKPYTVEDIRYAKFPVEEVHVNTINNH